MMGMLSIHTENTACTSISIFTELALHPQAHHHPWRESDRRGYLTLAKPSEEAYMTLKIIILRDFRSCAAEWLPGDALTNQVVCALYYKYSRERKQHDGTAMIRFTVVFIQK